MHVQGFQYFNFTMTESQLFFKHKKVGLISSLGNCQMTKHSLDTDSKIQFPAKKKESNASLLFNLMSNYQKCVQKKSRLMVTSGSE